MKVQITCNGTVPLLMKNVQLADPLNPATKRLKALTGGKQSKDRTPEDFAKIEHAEFDGSLYWDKDMGPYVPGRWMEKAPEGCRWSLPPGHQDPAGPDPARGEGSAGVPGAARHGRTVGRRELPVRDDGEQHPQRVQGHPDPSSPADVPAVGVQHHRCPGHHRGHPRGPEQDREGVRAVPRARATGTPSSGASSSWPRR